MLSKLWVLSALCAIAFSAPPPLTYSSNAAARPEEMKILSDYFNMLASKVREGKNMAYAPVCDLSKAVFPTAPGATPLPDVSPGLTLKHVAIGRGTQNYTCGTNATAAPVAVGALATLYNATCIAATYPDLLDALPNVALQFNLSSTDQASLTPSNIGISGHHFFSNGTTPAFDLDTSSMQLGFASCSKNNSQPAPAGAPIGQDSQGFGAVPWLKLLARDGTTGNIEEVYRLQTAGGQPPLTCSGMPPAFEIQYGAQYWFFQKP